MVRAFPYVRAAPLGILVWILANLACNATDPPPPPPGFPPPDTLRISVPGFPSLIVPPDNPTTVQGVALGRRLFYEKRLSGDNSMSCGTCHQQRFAFSDGGQQFSSGIDGSLGSRNAPSLTNVGFLVSHFWDGRAASLEDQAVEPVADPTEMKEDWDNVVVKLQNDSEYPDLFGQAFGSTDITRERIVKAIAQFERTLISNQSRYDEFLLDSSVFTDLEREGFLLFFNDFDGECFHCHNIRGLFTARGFHDIGLDAQPTDAGRAEATSDPFDHGKFKAPTLRNLAFTAPYMHDGRFETLEEVIDHYCCGVQASDNVDNLLPPPGLGFDDRQKQALIAFLNTLNDTSFVTNPDFSDPFD